MARHFSSTEFEERSEKLKTAMDSAGLDAMLLFSQESMYWLTGYDTFGFCFFQCLVVTREGQKVLLTRSADQRQAAHTSNIKDIRIWVDQLAANPVSQLKDLLFDIDLLGSRIGVEFGAHGMRGDIALQLNADLTSFANIEDATGLVPALRSIKSADEIAYIRHAANLADEAYAAALSEICPGADEGHILAAMQRAVLEGGGDYPANEFVLGSGRDALLVRYKSGRRLLEDKDQITLEWAGVYRHYHAAGMRTVLLGPPGDRHLEMHAAAVEAILAVEQVLRPGHTFGDLFAAHADVLDARGFMQHRLNACGYSLGARFAPSWMDNPMAFKGNPASIEPNMSIFIHIVLMDSVTETAMTLGRTYLTTDAAPESLSTIPLDLTVKSG